MKTRRIPSQERRIMARPDWRSENLRMADQAQARAGVMLFQAARICLSQSVDTLECYERHDAVVKLVMGAAHNLSDAKRRRLKQVDGFIDHIMAAGKKKGRK